MDFDYGPIWSTKLQAVAFRPKTILTSFVCASRFSGESACKSRSRLAPPNSPIYFQLYSARKASTGFTDAACRAGT